MRKILVVIDMQNDFIDGALGTKEAEMPEVKISVDPACCAGVTPSSHDAAIATMQSCQIQMV